MGQPSPAVRELAERLTVLGLETRQAVIYVILCASGPLRASEAAIAAGLHRTEAYRHLEHLGRLGFVTLSLERPVAYSAVPPSLIWDREVSAHAERGRELEARRAETLDAFARLGPSKESPPRHTHRILHTRPSIYATVEDMVRRARVSQWMVSTYFSPANATLGNAPLQVTRRRMQEGLPMRFLLNEQPGIAQAISVSSATPHAEARLFHASTPLRFTIVDGTEILYWLATDPSQELGAKGDVAMWTDAPDFVRAQSALYERLWHEAKPLVGELLSGSMNRAP